MTEISRVKRSKETARASYNRMSRFYDLLTGSSEQKYKDLGLALLQLQPGEKVLEIGFGTGKSLIPLARGVGESGQVFGVDLSEGMAKAAARRLEQAGLAERIRLSCGDAAQLAQPEASLEAIFLCFTLELFDTPEIPQVLAECRRVLKPGGRMVVVAMSKKGHFNLMTRLYDWAHEKWPAWVDCRPIYVEASLQEAGFNIQKSLTLPMWGLPVEIIVAEKKDE
jgi:ubiquinone/menaquinone biosynthesis C-methylase UbiE